MEEERPIGPRVREHVDGCWLVLAYGVAHELERDCHGVPAAGSPNQLLGSLGPRTKPIL